MVVPLPTWLCKAGEWWGKWGIRLAACSSLLLHIVVLLLANFRRYNKKWPGWLLFLWAAYQLLDIVGSYALGHLSLDSGGSDDAATESEQLLVAFWAPFLLLHLGGPDNLSAYSLDDDKLGWRKAFGGVPKALSALYVILINIWLADDGGLLRPASGIMFVVGFLRFFENVLAMVRALTRKQASSVVSLSEERQPSNAMLFESSVVEEEDPNSSRRRSIFSGPLEALLKEVTETANKIYEKVYTKAGEVHTWRGYLLRLLSPLATATAFILFGLYPKDKECVQQVDVTITYVLLSAALFLDLGWLLAALASTHALDFVKAKPGIWFRHQILCRGWWHRLNRFALRLHPGRLFGIDPTTYGSSCLGFFGRRDLLLECTRAPGRMARLWTSIFGEDVVWSDYRSWKCSSELPEELRELLLGRIKERFEVAAPGAYAMKDIRALWGQEAVRRRKQTFHGINLDFFGNVFQEDILLWHIATTIYLYSNDQQQHIRQRAEDVTRQRVHVIEAVSEYLMFLAAARPHMLPDPPLPKLYEVTQRALQEVYKNEKKKDKANDHDLSCASAKKKLADILRRRSEEDLRSDPNTRLIWYAARLASELLKAHESQLEHVVNLVFDVWVDKLLHAAIQCSRESHARQLGKGGELVTIAWITAEYAGVFEIGETGKGTTTATDDGGGGGGPGPGPGGNCIIKRPKCPVGEASCCYPKEKETCHCHQHPLEPVCPDTCRMKDYYCCTQDYYYC